MDGSKPAPLAYLTTAQRSAYGGIIAGFCLLLTCVLASSVRFEPRSGQAASTPRGAGLPAGGQQRSMSTVPQRPTNLAGPSAPATHRSASSPSSSMRASSTSLVSAVGPPGCGVPQGGVPQGGEPPYGRPLAGAAPALRSGLGAAQQRVAGWLASPPSNLLLAALLSSNPNPPLPPPAPRAPADPYFNYRITSYLTREGFYNTWNFFDSFTWYPLGRVIGGTMYPVSPLRPACGRAALGRGQRSSRGHGPVLGRWVPFLSPSPL